VHICHQKAHASLSEVTDAILKEEKVMDSEVGDDNLIA